MDACIGKEARPSTLIMYLYPYMFEVSWMLKTASESTDTHNFIKYQDTLKTAAAENRKK